MIHIYIYIYICIPIAPDSVHLGDAVVEPDGPARVGLPRASLSSESSYPSRCVSMYMQFLCMCMCICICVYVYSLYACICICVSMNPRFYAVYASEIGA